MLRVVFNCPTHEGTEQDPWRTCCIDVSDRDAGSSGDAEDLTFGQRCVLCGGVASLMHRELKDEDVLRATSAEYATVADADLRERQAAAKKADAERVLLIQQQIRQIMAAELELELAEWDNVTIGERRSIEQGNVGAAGCAEVSDLTG